MARVLFRELVEDNRTAIKEFMKWENYELNEKDLPVVEELKDHALMVLEKNYGRYEVEDDILDELCADVFTYFPPLMQQLAISRLMDAYSVPEDDTTTDTLTREVISNAETLQNSQLTVGTKAEETTDQNTQEKTTGTVNVNTSNETTQSGNTSIENTSGVEMTGNRSVNLTHNMPEQAITGGTGYFPTDLEGTPILTASYVQHATENFSSHNPINSQETSEQSSLGTTITDGDSTTTNDTTVANTGTVSRTLENSGSDTSNSTTNMEESETVTETRTQTATNKQYAYEIKAFLESVETINAFENWISRFSWVVGII